MKDDKIFGVRKGTLEILLLLLLMLLAVWLVSQSVSAANQSYALPPSNVTPAPTDNMGVMVNGTRYYGTVPNATPMPTPVIFPNITIRRIDQGGCVMPGETIDMAGIGWYTGYIAYYDQYRTMKTEGVNATKIYEVKPWELRKYYIDPALFSEYPGWWYSHYDTVESGNSQLFKVSTNCTLQNTTPQRAVVVENKTVLITGGITVPPKYVQGVQFIISRNTTTQKGASNTSHWWMFGDYDMKQYDIPVEESNLITFSRNMVNQMPTGRYSVIFIEPGANKIFEEDYDMDNQSIISPFRGVDSIYIGQPRSAAIAEQSLIERVNSSIDDTYTKITLELQDPIIEVHQLEQGKSVNGLSTMTLSGYTNTNPGDPILIEFDKGNIDRQLIQKNTWNTTVDMPYAPNAYRTWFKTVLFDPNDFAAGTHTLTLTTGSGATANPPITIRKELAEHYQQPEVIHFIANNPFVPTPTPEPAPPPVVVTVVQTVVETQIVVQEKIVPIDPYPYVIGGAITVMISAYIIYAVARAFVNGRRRKNGED